jgi:hypothetical protein
MNTIQLEANATRVFPRDVIPLRTIFSTRFRDEVMEIFDFAESEIEKLEEEEVVRFRSRDNAGPEFVGIVELTIQECRVQVTWNGDRGEEAGHEVIDEFFNEFGEQLSGEMALEEKWIRGFEYEGTNTVWVGKLEIDPLQLVDPRVRKALDAVRKHSSSDQRDAYLALNDFAFRIVYQIKQRDLLESQIYFKDRDFRLEPRVGVAWKERQWYSASPLRSEVHLGILKELEKAYQGS